MGIDGRFEDFVICLTGDKVEWFDLIVYAGPLVAAGLSILFWLRQIRNHRELDPEDISKAIATTDINKFGGQIRFDRGMHKGMYSEAKASSEVFIRSGSRVIILEHEDSVFTVKLKTD